MTTRPIARWDDEELGLALRGLDLAWPEPAADLEARVRTELESRPWRPPARSRTVKIVLLAAAIVLLLAAAAVGARLVFDLGAITIEPLPTGPLPTASELPDPGRPITLEEAEGLTGTAALVPAALDEPDRVWVDTPEDVPTGAAPTRIVMAWRAGPTLPRIPGSPFGAVLIRWDADLEVGVKLVGHSFRVVPIPGRGDGFWVSDPHELVLYGPDGPHSILVRGRVLLWGDDDTTFRLESRLSEPGAVSIAATTP